MVSCFIKSDNNLSDCNGYGMVQLALLLGARWNVPYYIFSADMSLAGSLQGAGYPMQSPSWPWTFTSARLPLVLCSATAVLLIRARDFYRNYPANLHDQQLPRQFFPEWTPPSRMAFLRWSDGSVIQQCKTQLFMEAFLKSYRGYHILEWFRKVV